MELRLVRPGVKVIWNRDSNGPDVRGYWDEATLGSIARETGATDVFIVATDGHKDSDSLIVEFTYPVDSQGRVCVNRGKSVTNRKRRTHWHTDEEEGKYQAWIKQERSGT